MLKKITTLRARLFAAIADRVARSAADYLLSHPSHRDQMRDQIAADVMQRLTADEGMRSQLFTEIADQIREEDIVEKVAEWHQGMINSDLVKRELAANLCEALVDSFDADEISSEVTEEIIRRMDVTVDVTV